MNAAREESKAKDKKTQSPKGKKDLQKKGGALRAEERIDIRQELEQGGSLSGV